MGIKIKLAKALSVKGESLSELDLKLDELTGLDLIEVEKQINAENNVRALLMPEYSKLYLAAVAAKALKIPREALNLLTAKDFTRVTKAVQDFLIGWDLETGEDLKADIQDTETVPRKS